MKIVSFNINSLRARFHQLEALINKHQPDVIALQETKVNDPDFPLQQVEALGYHADFHGQKTHYGVATLSLKKPEAAQKGFPTDDDTAQRRLITTRHLCPDGKPLTLINGYFPQGENIKHEVKFPAKRRFYADLQQLLEANFTPEDRVLVVGDFNISSTDLDIGIGEENRKRWLRTGKTSFQPEERQWMQKLLSWGLIDTYREQHPENNELFSWFDYRSKGFDDDPKRGLRIDLLLASHGLASYCKDTGIDYDIRGMEKPSDHAPVWSQFDFQ
ncbi:exodeoxyribonuclease-3 [Marinospirillum celere]|uniref:Exodeoxyribonuclease-3 n=1 Tax=Marinospirillum celere TaxID=1122252 RepID=A0A1I1EKX0_9GAMM|nr:exodeoxyribonuclease III [Marinospirillum celere]SFB86108.1 exodeoxyribonuclease-3 [Marinospirillum celere]